MRKTGLRPTKWLVLLIILMFTASNWTLAADKAQYDVEDGPIQLELVGPPARDRVEFVEFKLVRVGEDTLPLDFTLSQLVDADGNPFPNHLLLVETPYDSQVQTVRWAFYQFRLLAGSDEYAEVKFGVKYDEEVWAGTYQGTLSSPHGPDIPVEITVEPYIEVTTDPEQIEMDIPGPGVWETETPMTINVQANVSWTITLSSKGLFYKTEEADIPSVWAEATPYPPLMLWLVEEEPQPLMDGVTISGSGSTELSFGLQTKAGWEHRAGSYVGEIRIDVRMED
ncbi:MAG: hypothetical protein GX101_08130 [Firmicutes bacterium]|nr:hypothetical protein [Bacillota bacterium]